MSTNRRRRLPIAKATIFIYQQPPPWGLLSAAGIRVRGPPLAAKPRPTAHHPSAWSPTTTTTVASRQTRYHPQHHLPMVTVTLAGDAMREHNGIGRAGPKPNIYVFLIALPGWSDAPGSGKVVLWGLLYVQPPSEVCVLLHNTSRSVLCVAPGSLRCASVAAETTPTYDSASLRVSMDLQERTGAARLRPRKASAVCGGWSHGKAPDPP
jgi:hypothetical protein